jgi:hypothetical protein
VFLLTLACSTPSPTCAPNVQHLSPAAGAEATRLNRRGVIQPVLRVPRTATVEVDVPEGAELRYASVMDNGTITPSLAGRGGERVTLEFSHGTFGAPRVVVPNTAGCVPDVLLVVIDTLRADALGQGNSPTMDGLAEGGRNYTMAWSGSTWTKPGMVSLLTALLPAAHRVTGHETVLAETVPLVQERFRAAGYRTGSFAANPLASALSGLDRGWDVAMQPAGFNQGAHPSAEAVYGGFLSWLDAEPDQPFFAMVHTFEPHDWAGPAYTGTPQQKYAQSVEAADRHLASLLSELATRERTPLIALTSDHGESLGEHGYTGHGTSLYEEQLHIPLMLSGPGVKQGVVDRPVSMVDLAPTLLSMAGLAPLVADGQLLDKKRPRVTASLPMRLDATVEPPQHAWRTEDAKLMSWEDGRHQLYDLKADPDELSPSPAFADHDAFMVDITAWNARGATLAGAVEGPDATDALRALGYVD